MAKGRGDWKERPLLSFLELEVSGSRRFSVGEMGRWEGMNLGSGSESPDSYPEGLAERQKGPEGVQSFL